MFAFTLSPIARASAGDDAPLVRTQSGNVSGAVRDDVAVYEGIPYAAPPVGALRWRDPQPHAAWTGVRSASAFGYSCEQVGDPPRVPLGSPAETKSEDCLTLNVWTSLAHAAPLPVFVWIHGGGNANGTSAGRFYDGSAFARDGVVFVSLNYRLGALGFFAHPALAKERPGDYSGNFGLLDQIAALRWVQANIAAFGGDPANVTLAGESAGAVDTVLLATSAATNGLFERAIAESPGFLWEALPDEAHAASQGVEIAAKLGLPKTGATLAQLRALPAAQLAGVNDDDLIGPIADGRVIVGTSANAFEGAPRVPMIVGTNSGEGSLLGDGAQPERVVPKLSPDAYAAIRASYAASGTPGDAAAARRLFGDAFFAAPVRWVAARTVAAHLPAYVYRFDYVASFFAPRRPAATHGSEIPFAFETFDRAILDDTDVAVQTTVHGCWVSFAKTGTPTCPGVAAWPAYDAHAAGTMVFDAHSSVRDAGTGPVLDLLTSALAPR